MTPDEHSPQMPPPGAAERRGSHSWATAWLHAIRDVGSVSPVRRAAVLADIHAGSQPTTVYYVLLGVSELIAGFALIIDSDATLIGANVVAPPMTPIFGISLGLMRGDLRLLLVAGVLTNYSLNGRVTEAPLAPSMRLLQQAEQVAREVAPTRPDIVLKDVELVELPSGPVFVISIESSRPPTATDVARFESSLRERLGEPRLRVVVRKSSSVDMTAKGRILLGEAHLGSADPAEEARRAEVEAAVRTSIEARPDRFAAAVDAVRAEQGWRVRAEIVGPRVVAPAEVKEIEAQSTRTLGEPVALSVWARAELQVTGDGYAPLGD